MTRDEIKVGMVIRIKDEYAKKSRAIQVTDIYQGSETFMVIGFPYHQKLSITQGRHTSVMIWKETKISQIASRAKV